MSAHYGPLVPLMVLAVNADSLYLLLNRENLFASADSVSLLYGGVRRVSAAQAGLWLRGLLDRPTEACTLSKGHA